MSAAKILMVSGPGFGHINPMLPWGKALAAAGYQVFFNALDESYRSHVEQGGIEWLAEPIYPDYEHRKMAENLIYGNRMIVETCLHTIPSLKRRLESDNFRLVIHDAMAPWGRIAADLVGIPRVNSFSTFAINPLVVARSNNLPYALQSFWGGWRNLPAYFRGKKQMRNEYSLNRLSMYGLFTNIARWNVIYTLREIQPFEKTFPEDRYIFIGPHVDHTELSRPGQEGIVFVSLGTVTRNDDFWRQMMIAAATSSRQFVCSIGNYSDVNEWGCEIPGNVEIYHRVDQRALLRRASLFVTHCGMNSAHESLVAGVPTVMVPQQPEQAMVAVRLRKLGVGVQIRSKPSAAQLHSAMEEVLSQEAYGEAARQAAALVRRSPGVAMAVDKVNEILSLD